jgi:integrase
MEKGENRNHPRKGSIISVEPLRTKKVLADLKKLLADNPFDFALFVVGINTNLRASDLLNLRVRQVKNLKAGENLSLREGKTKKLRDLNFNQAAITAIQNLLKSRDYEDGDYLFVGQRGQVISVPALNLKIKRWMKRLNIKGNFGCHTLRKTWAFMQYSFNHATLPQLMEALNHSSQKITLRYIGIQKQEIADLYSFEI